MKIILLPVSFIIAMLSFYFSVQDDFQLAYFLLSIAFLIFLVFSYYLNKQTRQLLEEAKEYLEKN